MGTKPSMCFVLMLIRPKCAPVNVCTLLQAACPLMRV